jgi:lipid-A-disaccharide synthase
VTKKIFILSGEASGDLHAANLVHEMKRIQPNLVFQGWGGDRLQQEGVVIKKHIRELAFMGFLEVVLNLKTIQIVNWEMKLHLKDIMTPIHFQFLK